MSSEDFEPTVRLRFAEGPVGQFYLQQYWQEKVPTTVSFVQLMDFQKAQLRGEWRNVEVVRGEPQ